MPVHEAMTAEKPAIRRATTRRLFLIAAGALPFIVLAYVLLLGVNIPFSDEWDWIPFMYDAQRGTLTVAELWRQHNEHRMFAASLLVLGLARFGGWNLVREEIGSIVLCAMSQIVLWRLVSRTLPASAIPASFFVMSLALWNVGQAENFAMGLQIGWFLMEFCVLLVVWRLSGAATNSVDLAIAGLAAIVASCCSEIGLLAWPVGLCALLLAREPRRSTAGRALAWIVGGAVFYACFRIGLTDVRDGHVPVGSNLVGLALYALAYLGVPLAFWCGFWPCVATGAALIIALGALIATDVIDAESGARRRGDRTAWYALALFAVLGAIGTGPSRLGLGLHTIVTGTRYILVSCWLTIAIVGLIAQRFPSARDVRARRITATAAFMVVVAFATSISWLRGTRDWQHFSAARRDDLRDVRAGHDSAVAPYYVHRNILYADIAQLRHIRNGPLGP